MKLLCVFQYMLREEALGNMLVNFHALKKNQLGSSRVDDLTSRHKCFCLRPRAYICVGIEDTDIRCGTHYSPLFPKYGFTYHP